MMTTNENHPQGKNDVHAHNRDINNIAMGKLLTVNDVAEWLQIKPRTIRDWVYHRKIPYVKVLGCLRFDPDAIRHWLKGGSVVNHAI